MKKLMLFAVMAVAGLTLVGCSQCCPKAKKDCACADKIKCCKKSNPCCNERTCKDGRCQSDGYCGPCRADYCKKIGVKLADPRVRAGKEVKFEDGIIIRNFPKNKITK